MRAFAMVVLGLLLAGCAKPEAGADDGAPTSSGSASSSAEPTTPLAPVAATPVAVSWSGHTKEGAWVCMQQGGTGQCPAGQQIAPDGQHATGFRYVGNLTAVDVTMTWTAADPSQTGLVLAAYGNTSAGQSRVAVRQGGSPLRLQFDATPLGLVPDGLLVLMVWPEGKTPTSPSVFVDATQQPFTVEGTLWETGPAAG